jgi:hypothetical protein
MIRFKKIEQELLQLDALANECGFFTSDTDRNNGYGCTLPDNIPGFQKQEPGCCFGFDCPLAWEAHRDDLKKHDEGLYEEYKDEEYGPEECGSGWMIKYREVV